MQATWRRLSAPRLNKLARDQAEDTGTQRKRKRRRSEPVRRGGRFLYAICSGSFNTEPEHWIRILRSGKVSQAIWFECRRCGIRNLVGFQAEDRFLRHARTRDWILAKHPRAIVFD